MSPIKKAAANAAAKARRWIKELQINVSEHRAINRKSVDSSGFCRQWRGLNTRHRFLLSGGLP
jgi:hypothetical protein